MVGSDGKVDTVLVFIGNDCGYSVPKVDMATRKVEILGIAVVSKDIALQAKPVAVVLGVPLATLGQVPGLGNFILSRWSAPTTRPPTAGNGDLPPSLAGMRKRQCAVL